MLRFKEGVCRKYDETQCESPQDLAKVSVRFYFGKTSSRVLKSTKSFGQVLAKDIAAKRGSGTQAVAELRQ